MEYTKSCFDSVATCQKVAENIGKYHVLGEDENKYLANGEFVKIDNYDYYGSSLSDYRRVGKERIPYEDYKFFSISVGNFDMELSPSVKEEAEKYIKRGWNRKYDNITRNRHNWVFNEDKFNEVKSYLNELFEKTKEAWGEDCLMSDIEVRDYEKKNARHNERYAEARVTFGLRKKGLPKKGEAPKMCKDCPYFSMQGVETSHEWVEFYPYCSKMNKALGDYDTKKNDVVRPENCPLV